MRRRLIVFALCLSVVLPAPAAITGYVMTTNGQPIAGAKVDVFAIEALEAMRARLLNGQPERTPLLSGDTDAKGRFTIDSPKDAVVTLRITAKGYAPALDRIERDEDAGAIALTAAETKTGRITADGKPVAGATVVFNRGEVTATTDAEGRYSVPDPSKWAVAMTVVHRDYALADNLGGVSMSRAGALDRSLTTGNAVSGTVVGEDGKTPVAGAIVAIAGWPLATSAQDGTFTVRHAPVKWETITARSGDLIGERSRPTNASPLVVKLAKSASLTGSIRDAKTKMPLAGAEVRVSVARFGPAESWTTVSDAKSNFAIAALAPGSYQMNATRPGYTFASTGLFSLKASEKAAKSLTGTQLARISGTVVDEQKRPIAAARIAAQDLSRGMMPPPPPMMRGTSSAVSAPDGSFAIRTDPDVDLQLIAVRTGYPPAKTPTLHVASGERKSGIVLTVLNGIAITGRVLDKDGKPVGGVSVMTSDSSAGGEPFRRMVMRGMRRSDEDQVKTSNDGTFTVRVKEGTYSVVFRRTGYATRTLRAMHATASAPPLEVTLQPAVEISGRVTRNGSGVEGVSISAIGEGPEEDTETAPDGSFRLTDLSPGELMLNVAKTDEFIRIMRPVTAPAANVNIEVPPGARISGRVVDKDTKQPIPAFDIGVGMARGGAGMSFVFTPTMRHFTSDDGSFVLENVPSGQTQILVNAPRYTTGHVANVNIEDGKNISDVEVDLEHGVRVVGHVTGPDGSPLPGVSVRLDMGGARMMRVGVGMNMPTVTDANGDYAMDAVESGDKTFIFTSSGLQTAQKTATLSGTETRVDAQLSAGMTVYGTVVTDTGAPVADAAVNASSAAQSAGFGATRTDANGSFSFQGLGAGRYTFNASKSGYTSGSVRDVDISSGAPVRITLKSGGVIYGHVSGLTPDELQEAIVQATSANGGSSAPVDASGNYRIEGAPVGTVRVLARTGGMAGGKTSTMQSVQVDPSTPAQVDIAFKSGTVITGRVTRNGSPLDGVVVTFTPKEAQAQTSARAMTANGGQYQVSGLDDAAYNVSVVDIQRVAPFTMTYQVHGSGTFDIDMKAASLRGRVHDTDGAAVVDASVEIHEKADASGMRLLNRTVQTDAAGTFTLDNVPPGAYSITAEKDGYGTKSVETNVGDNGADVEIALAQNAGVALRVIDARTGQVLRARVHVTDAAGAAVYDTPFMGGGAADTIKLPLESGTYRAQINVMGYAPQTVTITSPSTPTIGVTPGGSIAVQSKAGGLRRARLMAGDGKPYAGYGFFTVDPAPGVTTLNNIAPGMYTIQILGDKNEVTATAPVTVVEGQTASVPL